MSLSKKNIYELLPSIYRSRDGDQDEVLKALIGIIAHEAKKLEVNIDQLYQNWFIETCEEWVVPYIGDLLGVRNLNNITLTKGISQRAYVANTIRYRRRKGTAPVLEQLALDTTGWRAHVTEFFGGLATSQYMNHVRPQHTVTPDLRKMNQLELLNSAFDTIAHTADVRHISNGRGKYNILNIGLFVWRLQSYQVTFSDPLQLPCAALPGEVYYTFDPGGHTIHLFNKPQTETSITHISTELNVPCLLRRRVLFDELEARRQALIDIKNPKLFFFDERNEYSIDLTNGIETDSTSPKFNVFEIFTEDDQKPDTYNLLPPEQILICNLKDCCTIPTEIFYKQLLGDGTYLEQRRDIVVAVDPVLGKFKFSDPGFNKKVKVNYSYGFSGDLGAGTHDRKDTIDDIFQNINVWQVGVSKSIQSKAGETIHTSIQDAVHDWNNNATGGTVGVIVIMDNCCYNEKLDIKLKEKSKLLIVAADWPVRQDPQTKVKQRITGDFIANDLRPHLCGDIKATGLSELKMNTGSRLTLNGLLIEGNVSVQRGNLEALNIDHCTILPGKGGVEVIGDEPETDESSNQWLKIKLVRSVTGPIVLGNCMIDSLELEDSVLDTRARQVDDAGLKPAIDSANVPVTLKASTILGSIHVKALDASNCIFTDEVKVDRTQTGCIRFCYLPGINPKTPKRYQCQPDLEINKQINDAGKIRKLSRASMAKIRNQVIAWLVPGFTSMDYGHYGYGQLNRNCPKQISSGAEDGSEMGAFGFLKQPQRMANLQIALDEYMPLGLEAGIFFET